MKDIKNYKPISLLSTCSNCSHGYYKNKWKRFLMKNQSREQAHLRKSYLTVDHL